MGTSLTYTSYLDSSTAAVGKPKLSGLDLNFLFDFHFVRRPKTDMMLGLRLGIAGIRYNPNDGTRDIYGSMGRTSDLHFTSRFYVSEKVGILANIAFPAYHFGDFGKNLSYTYEVKFSGINIGTGLVLNLTSKKE